MAGTPAAAMPRSASARRDANGEAIRDVRSPARARVRAPQAIVREPGARTAQAAQARLERTQRPMVRRTRVAGWIATHAGLPATAPEVRTAREWRQGCQARRR